MLSKKRKKEKNEKVPVEVIALLDYNKQTTQKIIILT